MSEYSRTAPLFANERLNNIYKKAEAKLVLKTAASSRPASTRPASTRPASTRPVSSSRKLDYSGAYKAALDAESRNRGDRDRAARDPITGNYNKEIANKFQYYFPQGHNTSEKRINHLREKADRAEQDRARKAAATKEPEFLFKEYNFGDYKYDDTNLNSHSPVRSDSSSSNSSDDLSRLHIHFPTNRLNRRIQQAQKFAAAQNYAADHAGGYTKLTKIGLLARIMNIKKKAAKRKVKPAKPTKRPAKPIARKAAKPTRPVVRRRKPTIVRRK
jgi:hypothetical protein